MKYPMLKRLVRSVASAAFGFAVTAHTGVAQAQDHTFRWSHSEPIGSISDIVTKKIAADIEEKSGGRIKINIFPANQLGDWNEVNEQVVRGVVDFATQPVSPSYDPRLQIRVLPYSVMNFAEAEDAYFDEDPYLFNLMSEMMAENDMTALSVLAQGFGGGGFHECPEGDGLDPAANSRLKMRFPPGNQSWEKLVAALGFQPTPLPWGEVYLSMQTGLVDAVVGGQPAVSYATFKDVLSCWVQYNTHFQNAFIFSSSKTWNSLSEEDQGIIRDAINAHAAESLDLARGDDQKNMDLMSESGIKVIIPTDEQLASLATLARQEIWAAMDDVIGKDIMDIMRKKAGI